MTRSGFAVPSHSSLAASSLSLSSTDGQQRSAPEFTSLTMRQLEDMGFSKDRILRTTQQMPSHEPRSFENILQALFESGSSSNPPSRPVSASTTCANADLQVPSSVKRSLVEMGFSSENIDTVITELSANASLEQVLEMLFAKGASTADILRNASRVAEADQGRMNQEAHSLSVVQALLDHIVSIHKTMPYGLVWRALLLINAAVRQKLITDEHRAELHGELENGDLELVCNFLAIIGVRSEPDMPLEDGEEPWECRICFSEQDRSGWKCAHGGHQFCHDCMGRHVEAIVFPKCPYVGCGFELEEADLLAIHASTARVEAFCQQKLRNAVDALATSGQDNQEVVIRCLREECDNAAVVSLSGPRTYYECPCGAPPFCTKCRQVPYHFHVECDQVQQTRQQWLDWLSVGRQRYVSLDLKMQKFEAALQIHHSSLERHREQVKALREGFKRHQELEQDEKWKVRNCRLCPRCRRVVQKVDGCDSMICGQNYHGGNQQPGCGAKFNWEEALPYEGQVTAIDRSIPDAPKEPLRSPRLDGIARGRGAYHPFVSCAMCGSCGIEGPRFRCIHCEKFDVCLYCQPALAEFHDRKHVFEVMYEADFDWTRAQFPSGMPVRIVRHGDQLPSCNLQDLNASLEAMAGEVRAHVPIIRGSIDHRRQLALGINPIGSYEVQVYLPLSIRNITNRKETVATVTISAQFVAPEISSDNDVQKLLAGAFNISKR